MIKHYCKLLGTLLAMTLLAGSAHATIIGTGGFASPTVIDFETAPVGNIGSFYAGLGITFVNFSTAVYQTSPAPESKTALKYFPSATGTDAEVLFASAVTRFGFDGTTNPEDDTTLFAYLNGQLVGSHFFDTVGDGIGGSFLGIEFLSGFDQVVIHTDTVINGAIAIDNVRFEATDVPEPGALAIVGLGLLALGAARRRRRG